MNNTAAVNDSWDDDVLPEWSHCNYEETHDKRKCSARYAAPRKVNETDDNSSVATPEDISLTSIHLYNCFYTLFLLTLE